MFRAMFDTQWALSEQRNGGRVAGWEVGGHPADWCCACSHFHLDHCGALPYFSEMVGYDGPIYMTQPTQAICPILLEDYRKIAVDKKGEANFFTSQMIKDCMKKVVAVHLHQTVQVSSTPHPQLTLLPSQGPLEAEGERGAQLRSSTEQGPCHSLALPESVEEAKEGHCGI